MTTKISDASINYKSLVKDTIEEHLNYPVDILNIGDEKGEYNYLRSHIDSYIRTVEDVDKLFEGRDKRILEIGSFLGATSVSLKKMGYDVFSLDIPEFYSSENLQGLYKRHEIPYEGINLRQYHLPYEDNFFDVVVICEVIEHLNFNPLPVLQEISRVTKNDGYLYIGMPNQASIQNRLSLLMGKSTHMPISEFFAQLDRTNNMIVGLHWREYTLKETQEMVSEMGFNPVKSYYFFERSSQGFSLKKLIKEILAIIPSFRTFQVVIGQKKSNAKKYDFWLTEANS